jgi:hypothetical protein
MNRLAWLLLTMVLLTSACGCGGGDRERGINKDRDLPRAGPTTEEKK